MLKKGIDFYEDNGLIVLTALYLHKRGRCCGNKCRECCYEPKWTKGNTNSRYDSKSSK